MTCECEIHEQCDGCKVRAKEQAVIDAARALEADPWSLGKLRAVGDAVRALDGGSDG